MKVFGNNYISLDIDRKLTEFLSENSLLYDNTILTKTTVLLDNRVLLYIIVLLDSPILTNGNLISNWSI